MLTLLKKGAPTLILEPESASDKTGKSVPGENGDARNQKNQIIEQEAGLTGDDGVQLVFALQVIAILEIRHKANRE